MNAIHSPKSLLRYLPYIVYGGIILYFGKSVFVPLSIALLISFVFYPVCMWLERHKINRVLAIGFCMTTLVLFVLLFLVLLTGQVLQFSDEWPVLKEKILQSLQEFSTYLFTRFGLTREEQLIWLEKLTGVSSGGLGGMLQSALYSSGVGLVLLLLIPVFSALMLYYRKLLADVLFNLFPPDKRTVIRELLHQTVHTYYNFIKGMLVVYLVVGVLNSIGLLLLGVPHAILFGFLVAILTFIPYVGIIIGSLLPITVSWITYNSVWYPIGVVAIFTFVQYLEANVIFPWAVSTRLSINTLATLIAILVGGILWGAAGMVLFVPFLAILKLIADKSKGMEQLSRLLSDIREVKPNVKPANREQA